MPARCRQSILQRAPYCSPRGHLVVRPQPPQAVGIPSQLSRRIFTAQTQPQPQRRDCQLLHVSVLSGAVTAMISAACCYTASETTRCDESARGSAKTDGGDLLGAVSAAGLTEMAGFFPNAPRQDLARFLVACKNDVAQACERYEKTELWRRTELRQMLRTVDISAEHRTGKHSIFSPPILPHLNASSPPKLLKAGGRNANRPTGQAS